jgi:DNA-binding NtrC family response regulator
MGQKGCILVVDDDEFVLDVSKQMLEKSGFKAIGAKTSDEAIDTYQVNRKNIDLVILDINLPDENGATTFKKIRKINPDAEVILSTGYTESSKILELMNLGCRGRLQKPYTMTRLTEEVSGALG